MGTRGAGGGCRVGKWDHLPLTPPDFADIEKKTEAEIGNLLKVN